MTPQAPQHGLCHILNETLWSPHAADEEDPHVHRRALPHLTVSYPTALTNTRREPQRTDYSEMREPFDAV